MCGEERRGSSKATARFRHRLADLKRNGCNILLVGTDALDSACERLLGESSAGPRYRLFVTTDAGPPRAHARLKAVQSGPYSDAAAVVDWDADVRGGTATKRSHTDREDFDSLSGTGLRDSGGPSFRQRSVDTGDLRDLGTAVEEAIEEFHEQANGLSPAELRLCFDSVTPLVADREARDVRRFLLGLTETVEKYDGMAHYHLPSEYDSETVAELEPLFDAVVEVRHADGEVEQRWHLQDPEITTDWVPL
ncbi:DUF7504 family protein [Halorussus lipolyticus]|uniref:DUF7504 family protein n=1 Tax=Halorussus lipolyticus TaxID=3034024 RepID=UPI0023E7BB6E|nr:hypothetical protein [Halorussus sp. DT80]